MSNRRRPVHPTQQHSPRSTQIIVGVVVLLCVAGIVLVQVIAGGADEGDASETTAASAPSKPGECTDPPAPQAEPKSYSEAPDPADAEGSVWTATITTNCGDIVVELDGKKAPQTVASFLFLAQDGYFDDGPCNRLSTTGIFVLQCGDPTGTGSGDPGYGYGVENAPADGRYPTGTLAMARSQDPNSNGGQFFIVYDDTQLPDPTGYTIFGKVTEGLDIVSQIAAKGVQGGAGDGPPAQPISILGVSVEQQ